MNNRDFINRHSFLICLFFTLTLLTGCWLSLPALSGPFLFDDFPNLSRLNTVGGTLDLVHIGDYLAQFPGNPGRPLSALSFLINDFAWPSESQGFKFTNLMLHLLVGVTTFGFARALAHAHMPTEKANWIALATLAAWLLHPMQLSTSMLVVQRMTQLSALFALAGLWAYTSIATSATKPHQSVMAIVVLGVATVLATLSKENGALVPLLACATNATLLRDTLANKSKMVRKILWTGCLLPVAALCVALAIQGAELTDYASREYTLTERFMTQTRVLMDYLRIIFIPNMTGSLYHDDFEISRGLLNPLSTLAASAALTAVTVAALLLRRKFPIFSFAVAWYLAGHALESTIFPLEVYFEHRNYVPMIGPLFAASTIIVNAASRKMMYAVLGLIWMALSTFLLGQQAIVWGNGELIATIWSKDKPRSQRATQQYSLFLQQSGRPAEAIDHLMAGYYRGIGASVFPLQALQIACTSAPSATDRDKLLAEATRSLSHATFDYGAVLTIGHLRELVQQDACPTFLTPEHWLNLTDRLIANPRFARSAGHAMVRLERGYYFRERRNIDATISEFSMAYDLSPSVEVSQLIAITFWSAGLNQEAIAWLEKGLTIEQPKMKRFFSSDDDESRLMLKILRTETEKPESEAL